MARAMGEDAPDGLKVTDDGCGGGLCTAGKAMTELQKLVTAGDPRQGGLSQVERALTTPMFLIVDAEVWDPDAAFATRRGSLHVIRVYLRMLRATNIINRSIISI